jgi:D-alanine transaminase
VGDLRIIGFNAIVYQLLITFPSLFFLIILINKKMNNQEIFFYLNGRFIKGKELGISPFDRGFLFADGVYETIRWHNGKLFKLGEHFERLKRSLGELKIRFSDFNELKNAITELVKINSFAERHLLVYLQITRGDFFPRQHFFPPLEIKPTVFISVTPFKPKEQELKEGIKVILSDDLRWARCDIKSTMLLPNIMARQEALEKNAGEAILVREDFITEGTHTNVFVVKDGKLYTHPLTNYILNGITRKVILEICRANKIPFFENKIKADELKSFDECMITGTISEVTPVVQVNDWKVGNGKPGPITLKLQKILLEMIST